MKKYGIFALVVLSSCITTKQSVTSVPASSIVVDGKLFTSIYQQKAAEYKALCFQAYNIARLRVDESKEGSKPKAIITDIDETVLDNSSYAVHQALIGKDYDPESWYEWTSKSMADTVPGAPTFFKYAGSRGITIFYITNRDEREKAATLANLVKYDLPNTDNDHLLMRQGISSKEERRQKIMSNYDVLLLVGDNLADFSNLFDKKLQQERETNTIQSASNFGDRFIILPNPNYGDWEPAFYKKSGLTLQQKDSVIRVQLKSY
ncbi:MAG TPA: 5'-nucleotidase, lipoprotein e(P4) family [Flavisolibacter sp.]|nr:5'-nucleotidase, lipoprotein e(P4) family [Flavisolibacter sp.]